MSSHLYVRHVLNWKKVTNPVLLLSLCKNAITLGYFVRTRKNNPGNLEIFLLVPQSMLE